MRPFPPSRRHGRHQEGLRHRPRQPRQLRRDLRHQRPHPGVARPHAIDTTHQRYLFRYFILSKLFYASKLLSNKQ